ncbi:hypothetical protein DICPUDRAFT_150550 [Dictyostelium purpureum]|uniref:Carbohydrate binding domain-containing protein n=1 Tax=Dictyostelium purpureum TaxID=5786 RepID=F0ZGL7_DICPU|nr:uncharacterized protein DICPUDRAFT_150550 [Dictyostelium purpureum]EGC36927.1 hypothetical protein DICPUDRAFT_150550 [Dictyostelium purpureum]|eukprot:XP_003286570.1 hypothetical protein DICPUDRAFT_150550 [Dictyostelium purpureum]
MKLISIICLVLLSIAFASAHRYGCGSVQCADGTISLTKFGICACIDIPKCHDVVLSTKVVATWDVNGAHFTQYDVTITNNLEFDIKNIFIGTCNNFRLKDNDNHNLWNMERCADNELTLPKVQPSINKNASYTFGFIVCGTPADQPNLAILAVTY